MKKCTVKCFVKHIPHIAFAAILVIMGAYGKLTGDPMAVGLFEQINLFGQGETFGRILVGLGQLAAAVGVFFKPTRKIAAILGIAIMLGAMYFHAAFEFGFPTMAIVTAVLGFWILASKKCAKSTCTHNTCDVK